MSLPKDIQASAEWLLLQFCLSGVINDGHAEFRIRGSQATLYKSVPAWSQPRHSWSRRPFARLRFDLQARLWTLDYQDETRKWRNYGLQPTADLSSLLDEVAADPVGVFL